MIQSDKVTQWKFARTEIWLKFLDKRLTLDSAGDPVGQSDQVEVCPDRDLAQISGQAFNPIPSTGDPVGQSDPVEVCPDRDLAQIPGLEFNPASAGDPVGQSDPVEGCTNRDLDQIPGKAFHPIASAGDPV